MATFKTPGAYVQEIQTLPASIASVATAVGGFTGYTEKAIINGAQWNYTNGPAPPVRITSLLEYQQIFGFPYHENFKATLADTVPQILVTRDTATNFKNFILYYQMQMFFSNGGGVCWVVSVGDYSGAIDKNKLLGGLDLFQAIDEVTLLLIPESISLTTAGFRKEINDAMLAQSAKLGDRFSIFDVFALGGTVNADAVAFRNDDVGPDNLKFGASYYPPMKTVLGYFYSTDEVLVVDGRTGGTFNTFPNNTLQTVLNGISNRVLVPITATIATTQTLVVNGVTFTAKTTPSGVNDFKIEALPVDTAANLERVMKNANLPGLLISRSGATVAVRSTTAGASAPAVPFSCSFTGTTTTPASPGNLAGGVDSSNDTALYNSILAQLDTFRLLLYPAPTMAGIYARVDNDRGVWQAPANVGVRNVDVPSILVTNTQQEGLNVDSTSGKSINVIRQFTGRGTVVWGARTLAGNDNEWRYVNVRRLFLMIEESTQEATEFLVFEPNTANTWERIKTMIESFLTTLWRDGALAGAVPKDAFFVQVGLGTTMTSDDILNGILNVRIGIAAVRPAEFIVLQFSHKLQVS